MSGCWVDKDVSNLSCSPTYWPQHLPLFLLNTLTCTLEMRLRTTYVWKGYSRRSSDLNLIDGALKILYFSQFHLILAHSFKSAKGL